MRYHCVHMSIFLYGLLRKTKIGIKFKDPDADKRIRIKIDPSPKRNPKRNKKEGTLGLSKKKKKFQTLK